MLRSRMYCDSNLSLVCSVFHGFVGRGGGGGGEWGLNTEGGLLIT